MILCKFVLNYLWKECFITIFFVRPLSVLKRRGGERIPPPSDVLPTKKHADVTRVKNFFVKPLSVLKRRHTSVTRIKPIVRFVSGDPYNVNFISKLPWGKIYGLWRISKVVHPFLLYLLFLLEIFINQPIHMLSCSEKPIEKLLMDMIV